MKAVPGFILVMFCCLIATVGAPVIMPFVLVGAGLYALLVGFKEKKPPSPPPSSP